MARVFAALAEEPNGIIKDFILVALLTGARRRNVQALEWSEIDWRRAIWTIPSEKSKNGEAIDIGSADRSLGSVRPIAPPK